MRAENGCVKYEIFCPNGSFIIKTVNVISSKPSWWQCSIHNGTLDTNNVDNFFG